jgi:hypothetical protein
MTQTDTQPPSTTQPQVLPPMHPMCKVFDVCELLNRARAAQLRGDCLEAVLLEDAIRAAIHGTSHKP